MADKLWLLYCFKQSIPYGGRYTNVKIPFILGTTVALVSIVNATIAHNRTNPLVAGTPAEIKTIAQAVTVDGKLSQTQAIKLSEDRDTLADYDRAIAIDPNYAVTYYCRGNLQQFKLNDDRGALADYDRAIQLDPNLAQTYNNRGFLKQTKFNDARGALADYNRSIALNPNYAYPYGARGLLKYGKLKDRAGGIADVQTAARLAKAQGNTQVLNTVLNLLQSWGVSQSESPKETLRERGF